MEIKMSPEQRNNKEKIFTTCYVCRADGWYYNTNRMCKPCRKQYDAGRKNRGKYNPKNNVTQSARERKRRWAKANKNKDKIGARMAVRRAIVSGTLKRPEVCDACKKPSFRCDGVSSIQGHHDDYSKPLDVSWLCPTCHKSAHAAIAAEGK